MKLRFGKLTLALPHEMRNGKVYVLCRCDCGAEVWMREDKLERRASCGCIARERTPKDPGARGRRAQRPKRFIIPDDLRSTYGCWESMRKRCRQPNFKYHHGLGITVCQRWDESFMAFVEDVGRRPSQKHTIDRYPNNAGNYEPGNVRWATMSEQNYNRRPRVPKAFLEYNGESLSYPEMIRRTGLSISALRHRVRDGWSAERILTQPARRTRRGQAAA